jgi:His/Glu/Gln/Arg/opine family amino acid ABC transporter permease subunit
MELIQHFYILRQLIVKGFTLTIELSVLALLLSLIVGIIGGIIRFKKIPVLHSALGIYINAMRGIPFIVLVLLVYYATPLKSRFAAATIALTLCHAAYATEIICGGLHSIRRDQFYAARSLGMAEWQVMRYAIIPQVMYATLPAMIGQLIILLKDTALCSAIGFIEITKMGRSLMQVTGHPHIVFTYVLILYFILCHLLKMIGTRVEVRAQTKIIGKGE